MNTVRDHAGEPQRLVLGADIGGTSTRIAVATVRGEVVGYATGPGANPAGEAPDDVVARIVAVRDRAMATVPVVPLAATIGLAGITAIRDSPLAARLTDLFSGTPTRLVSDLVIAFASGTHLRDGVVAIAGTGAAATEIVDGDEGPRRDGWGWLLGDEGSGFWIGREAVRATLRRLERGEAGSPLVRAVLAEYRAHDATGLVAASYAVAPRTLSRLAPLVSALADDDPDAAVIVEQAARLTSERIVDLLAGRTGHPVVLAGSLVTGSGPLARPVRDALAEVPVAGIAEAGDGLAGAIWLAIGDAGALERPDSQPTGTPADHWSGVLGSLARYR